MPKSYNNYPRQTIILTHSFKLEELKRPVGTLLVNPTTATPTIRMTQPSRINSSSAFFYLVGVTKSPLQLFRRIRGVVFLRLEAHKLRLKLLLLPAELTLLGGQSRPLLLRLYRDMVKSEC